jgi:hypothetical protein
MLPHLVHHLLGEVGAGVEHGHDDAAEGEAVVDVGGFEAIHIAQDLAEALEREVLALQGDEELVGGGQTVHGQHPEGGRAVDDDGAVTVRGPDRFEDAPELHQVILHLGQLDFCGREVLLARDEGEVLVGGGRDHLDG